MENSKIEWCDDTVNLWIGCTEVHAGCDNCYARVQSHRWGKDLWGNDKGRQRVDKTFPALDKSQRLAKKSGKKRFVFVGSLMDIFEKSMPLINPIDHYTETDDLRQEFFSRIIQGLYPDLIFLLLTKRPSNIAKYVPAGWLDEPEENIFYGTSPVDQKTADTLIPQLLEVNGKRFLSVEPQLGPIDLCESVRIFQFKKFGSFHSTYFGDKIHWVIQGGESGHHKRPFDIEWADSVQKQCKTAGVPYFFKQIDKVQEVPVHLMNTRQFPVYAGL